jgi:hypothetical protein
MPHRYFAHTRRPTRSSRPCRERRSRSWSACSSRSAR